MRRKKGPRRAPPRDDGPAINDNIRARRVVLIDEEGTKLGEFMVEDAVNLAMERGLDLVEVAPNARPPVCKIADYGRMKYERKKKANEARKKSARTTMKELKVRPKTDDHDMSVKTRKAEEFLKAGHKVKVTVWFRGREHAHHDIGAEQCLRIAEAVKEISTIEAHPHMEGRRMFMVLAPA